ncbi:bifunctional riboflavin kinase/FAD synthetase [Hyphomicrobium sp.]|uniref:bifunctional riboflavin kinase/FAD synthetase n=1 Tax=Hyphomicrobium sp. TaxID=82 RepID=UPI000FBEE5DA|nr:bifunctional riboflavin kinase/FAD synthetase [Hyphomicrobium sp.]MBN9246775.1 bifunctional riboflavin kinase/FAD synthetase [Hyphomicrobium sp.]RUP08169.1 MAG: bifunctional riboflavin kinase/FAD synthetase [Hyphomicrobium sp.]
MHVIHGHKHVLPEFRGSAIAIGNFDGVHRGHRALISEAKRHARDAKAPSAVMIFEPHPREFFQPDETHFRLTPLKRKIVLLETLGIDVAFVEPFNAELAALTAEQFIERVLVAGLGVVHVVIGYDFYFGHKRGGNPELMVRAGEELGFGVTVMPPIAEAGEPFSSSGVRLYLAQGDVKGAAHVLGENWRVAGRVVGGAKRGTGMGYPTANLPMPKGTTLGHGIYAVRAYFDGIPHDAAAYLGTRPTFDDGMPVLEVYLFDFSGDLYGREMEVEFIDFIRGDRKFHSVDELVAQMDEDIAKVQAVLAKA